MGALIAVKGLNLDTFPLPHSCTTEASWVNQAESRLPVNGAVKRKRFRGKSFRTVITDGFTAILYAVEGRVYSPNDQKKSPTFSTF